MTNRRWNTRDFLDRIGATGSGSFVKPDSPGVPQHPGVHIIPEQVHPEPERVAGPVFPYRGMEQHGVAVSRIDDSYYDITEQVVGPEEVEDPVPVLTPIPVYLTNRTGNERRVVRTAQFLVGTTSVRIVNRNDGRSKVRIKNLETAGIVWISGEQTITGATFDGYPLSPGENLELDSEDEVFAVGDGVGTGGFNRVAIVQQTTVELG